jgi:hypothetical protein
MWVSKSGFTRSDHEPDMQNFIGVVGDPASLLGCRFGYQKTMEQF